jgi:hypothetical protein
MPYLKHRSREVLFREAILGFLGVGPAGKDGKCTPSKKRKCQAEFGEFLDWACKNCKERMGG